MTVTDKHERINPYTSWNYAHSVAEITVTAYISFALSCRTRHITVSNTHISPLQAQLNTTLPTDIFSVACLRFTTCTNVNRIVNWLIDLRPCQQHDDGYMDGRSQIKVHTDERTQVHSAQSSLVVTHPSTNRGRRYLTSVTESPNKHWSPLRTLEL